jgi:hypothetical protein
MTRGDGSEKGGPAMNKSAKVRETLASFCDDLRPVLGEGRAWIMTDQHGNVGSCREPIPPWVQGAFYVLYADGKPLWIIEP